MKTAVNIELGIPSGTVFNDRYRVISFDRETPVYASYSAIDLQSGRGVKLKICYENAISHRREDYIRFQNCVKSLREIEHHGIERVFDAEHLASSGASARHLGVIAEPELGGTLHDFTLDGHSMSTPLLLSIAGFIAESLVVLHSRGLLHGSLTSKSIMVDQEQGEMRIKTADICMSRIIEHTAVPDPEEAIFLYGHMPPEYSGIVHRQIDERSDLYSLGVILYKLMTGHLPITGKTAVAIIHGHIASMPSFPETDMPDTVGFMVMKLLEKEPEKRYQSAESLLRDIERITSGDTFFIPGREDGEMKLTYRSGMVGRAGEYALLKKLHQEVISGHGRFVLISGEAGSGKTRLVEELSSEIVLSGGMLLQCKCFPGAGKEPYAPLREIVDKSISHIESMDAASRAHVIQRLREAAGELGAVLLHLSPSLEKVLGELPPPVELEASKENERFISTVTRFLLTLSSMYRGCVFFIDDLQWMDRGTFEIIMKLLDDLKSYPLLIIGASRTGEEGICGDLPALVEKTGLLDHGNILPLKKFGSRETVDLVRGLLYAKEGDIDAIADYSYARGGGNPFFTVEIIKSLVGNGIITRSGGSWNITDNTMADISIPESVIDLVMRRIRLLGRTETDILSHAALLGKEFSTGFLFEIIGRESEEVLGAVDAAQGLQILERGETASGTLRFCHDRIRESFISFIESSEKMRIHRNIVAALERILDHDTEPIIFDLAHHSIESGLKERIIHYAYEAGMAAMRKYAHEDATRYLDIVRSALEESGSVGTDRWSQCMYHLGAIQSIVGRNPQSLEIYETLLPRISDNFMKAKILMQMCVAYGNTGNMMMLEKAAGEGFSLLGEKLPLGKGSVIIGIIKELFIHFIQGFIPGLRSTRRSEKDAEKTRMIILLYHELGWMYIFSDIMKFVRAVLRMLNLSERRLGNSPELWMSVAGYASLLMAIPVFARAIRLHRTALRMRRELNDVRGIAESLHFTGYCHQWMGNFVQAIPFFNESVEISSRIGDMDGIVKGANGLVQCFYYLGRYREMKSANFRYTDAVKRSSDEHSLLWCALYDTQYLYMTGELKSAAVVALENRQRSMDLKIPLMTCKFDIELASISLDEGRIDDAVRYIDEAKELFESNNFMMQYSVQLYPLRADIYLTRFIKGQRAGHRAAALKQLRRCVTTALGKTRHWPTHHPWSLRCAAKFSALMGRGGRGEKLLLKSLELAERTGMKLEVAKGYLELGNYLRNAGMEKESSHRLYRAYSLFREIGSRHQQDLVSAMTGFHEDIHPSERIMDRQKLLTMIRVSQDISTILDPEELLESIIQKAMEVTGALRGYIFLLDRDSPVSDLRAFKGLPDAIYNHSILILVNQVFKSGRPFLSDNAMKDFECMEWSGSLGYEQLSVLCVPIGRPGRNIGVCYLDNPLSTGVFTADDEDLLSVFMTQAAIAVENAELYRNLEQKVEERTFELNEAYGLIKEDLRMAKAIQNNILSKDYNSISGVSIDIRYLPCGEIGGDIYDIAEIRPGVVRVFLADATGHGIQAALVTMIIKGEYEQIKYLIQSPSALLHELNNRFILTYGSLHTYFTCAVVDIDLRDKEVRYSSAGHLEQYLISGDDVLTLSCRGIIIGFIQDYQFREMEQRYEGDAVLFMYTDGLIDTPNFQQTDRAVNAIKATLRGRRFGGPGELNNGVIALRSRISPEGRQDDDITIITVSFR